MTMYAQKPHLGFLAVAALVSVLATPAAADMEFGARMGYYTDAEAAFMGGEIVLPLSASVNLNPNGEYVLSDDRDQYTLNLDATYTFPSEHRSFIWLGGGVSLFTVNDHTDMFTNFLAGVGLARETVVPYFQIKIVAKDDAEIVLAFGLRF
jgi:hypothetical protein